MQQGEIYTHKYSENCYFNLIKITDANKAFWQEIGSNNHKDRQIAADAWNNLPGQTPEEQKFKEKKLEVFRAVEAGVAGADMRYGKYANADQWVAVASYEPIAEPYNIKSFDNIEMTMSVCTSSNAPFTTHMGIFRPYKNVFNQANHPNLAMHLHAFCAAVMHQRYPDKKYMINAPLPIMKGLVYKHFKAIGPVSEAVHFFPTSYTKLPDYNDRDDSNDYGKINVYYLDLQIDREEGKNLKAGKDFAPFVDNMGKSDCKFYDSVEAYQQDTPYLSFRKDDPEYQWFTKWKNINMAGKMTIDLAKLAEPFQNIEITHCMCDLPPVQEIQAVEHSHTLEESGEYHHIPEKHILKPKTTRRISRSYYPELSALGIVLLEACIVPALELSGALPIYSTALTTDMDLLNQQIFSTIMIVIIPVAIYGILRIVEAEARHSANSR